MESLPLIKLNGFWERNFPNTGPFSDQLKYRFAQRWVRFHHLPESKRYPESEAEFMEILGRRNRIIDELYVDSESLGLIFTNYSDVPRIDHSQRSICRELFPNALHWRSLPISDDEEFPVFGHFYCQMITLPSIAFDQLCRLVAENKVNNVMLVSFDGEWLIHPYDGGFDVIVKDCVERDKLARKFVEWLSPHPEGL